MDAIVSASKEQQQEQQGTATTTTAKQIERESVILSEKGSCSADYGRYFAIDPAGWGEATAKGDAEGLGIKAALRQTLNLSVPPKRVFLIVPHRRQRCCRDSWKCN